jgi:hypothetical protein
MINYIPNIFVVYFNLLLSIIFLTAGRHTPIHLNSGSCKLQEWQYFRCFSQLEDVRQYTSTQGVVNYRNGNISDATGHIAFCFWRELADFPFALDQVIKITRAARALTTSGEPKLTGNKDTTIEVSLLYILPTNPSKILFLYSLVLKYSY